MRLTIHNASEADGAALRPITSRAFKHFAARLRVCVSLFVLWAAVALAQTNALPPGADGANQLADLQKLLQANLQLQEQLRAARLAIDQTGALLAQPDAPPAAAGAADPSPDLQGLLRVNLQLQEQLDAARLAIDQNQKEVEAAAARNAELVRSTEAVSARLNLLEQDLADQLARELEAMRSSNRFMLIVAAGFASVGLLAILLTAFFHRHTLNQLGALPVAYARGPGHAVATVGLGDTSLVPADQTEQSNARLLGAIDRLDKQILELEQTSRQPVAEKTAARPEPQPGASARPEPAEMESRIAILLGKGQSLLHLDQQENAIACFDGVLELDPGNAKALLNKGTALEQLDRLDEAIACYDCAIDADRSMTTAYLRKGGVCNRMARHSEALECYEQALRTQDTSHAV